MSTDGETFRKLNISGQVLTDDASLKKYSADMSHYAVKPKLVAIPENDEDIAKIIDYSKEENIPLTCRGAGSNQSGSAVGSGIIVLFSKMNRVIHRAGKIVNVQPGIIHGQLDQQLRKAGFNLPYDPSSRSFCTVGGNVATKACGIRSLKYGSVDSALKSICFFDTQHGKVDTSKPLPADLETAITNLRDTIRKDKETQQLLSRRKTVKSSSGYNLKSFLEYDAPEQIITHLMAGSVGTLSIFTEIKLEATPTPESAYVYLLFFPSLASAAENAVTLKSLNPSALEIMDTYGQDLLKRDIGIDAPNGSQAVLIVEFDSDLKKTQTRITNLFQHKSLKILVETDPARQAALWRVRESMLLHIMKVLENEEQRFPPFADDIAVPPERLAEFVIEIQNILEKTKTQAFIYGHAGEGNLHVRPLIRKENWQENVKFLADRIFNEVLKYDGTISGEHGSGRNRSKYLPCEWGDRIYGYFKEIKSVFDPSNLLNPGIMFTENDVTKNLQF